LSSTYSSPVPDFPRAISSGPLFPKSLTRFVGSPLIPIASCRPGFASLSVFHGVLLFFAVPMGGSLVHVTRRGCQRLSKPSFATRLQFFFTRTFSLHAYWISLSRLREFLFKFCSPPQLPYSASNKLSRPGSNLCASRSFLSTANSSNSPIFCDFLSNF